MSKKQMFVFACHLSRYRIPPGDTATCSRSFFNFARQLANIRDGINTNEQKVMFDLEVRLDFFYC